MKNKVKSTSPQPAPAEPRPGTSGEGAGKADEFKMIPRAELHPDPDQPRKTFDEASLKELAESIAQQGIVQPLIVRLVKAQFKIEEPELHFKDYRLLKRTPDSDIEWTQVDCCDEKNFKHLHETWGGSFGGIGFMDDYQDRYVIVAGERRWRASEIAGLTKLPCIVRDLDAHKVFAQQFIENEQRVNISALEEAEALTKQLEKRKAESGNFSVEDLAKELGMSRAGLYQRLALTRLHAPVREALLAGKISTSVASVVAIVPTPAAQEKLLKEITNEDAWNFPFSVRDVQDMVDEEYCKQLSSAPFKQDEIYPEVEWKADTAPLISHIQIAPTCKGCQFRTGNMVDMFPDLAKRPNVCTKPDCFAQKVKAHWLEKSQDLAQKGKTVLTAKEFRKVSSEYLDADKPTSYGLFDNKYDSASKVLGKHAPEPVIVATAEGLKKYFKRSDIPAAAKSAKVKLAGSGRKKTETAEQKAKREEKEKADKAKAARFATFSLTLLPRLAGALDKLKDLAAWELLAGFVDNQTWMKERTKLLATVKTDKGRVLAGELWHHIDDAFEGRGLPEKDCLKVFETLGLDVRAEFEAEEKQAQPALALPKAEKKHGKLPVDVKPNKKKAKKK